MEGQFIADTIGVWLAAHETKITTSRLARPRGHAYVDNLHVKLRDVLLNREIFTNLSEAKTMLEDQRKEYNDERSHSLLDYLPLTNTPRLRSLRSQKKSLTLR